VYLASFIVYFGLGYLLYAALLCGIGSLANNLKEAQTLMMPIQLLLTVPLLVMVPIGRDPNGMLAQVMSWLPPFTPFVMMNRAAFPPPLATYVGTTALLLLSIYVALRLAARIFETGILMTGKPPRFRQLLALLRRSHDVA
jgi:ABC-2 type transport system permease protein